VEKYCTAGKATDDNMAHVHFMLDNKGYWHTISRIQTHTQCTRLNTGSLGPQPQHLVLNTICSSTQPTLLKMDIWMYETCRVIY